MLTAPGSDQPRTVTRNDTLTWQTLDESRESDTKTTYKMLANFKKPTFLSIGSVMHHRLSVSLRSLSSYPFNSPLCIRHIQKRLKHGRDFPRNIPPPPPPSGKEILSTPSMTLLYTPAPSAPSHKSTPASFLPEPQVSSPTSLYPIGMHLPPPLTKTRKRQKIYHLSQEDIDTMRHLRNHPDPNVRRSRTELAKMFGCSQLFVGMAAPRTKEEVNEIYKSQEERKALWGDRKRTFREARQKRREQWAKDVD